MRKENDGDSRGGAVRASLTLPRCSTNLLSSAAKKFGIPPLSKLGFAGLPSFYGFRSFAIMKQEHNAAMPFHPFPFHFPFSFRFSNMN